MRSFEMLASLGPVRPHPESVPYGGGSGGFSSIGATGDALRALSMLLEFLEQHRPDDPGLFALLAKVLATLAPSSTMPHAPSIPLLKPQAAPFGVMMDATIVDVPLSAPSPLASGPAGAAGPVPADALVVNPTEPPAPAPTPVNVEVVEPTEALAPTPTSPDVQVPATDDPTPSSSAPTATEPEPSKAAPPETNSSKPDPPSSSGGESDGRSAGGSGAGSSGSSGREGSVGGSAGSE